MTGGACLFLLFFWFLVGSSDDMIQSHFLSPIPSCHLCLSIMCPALPSTQYFFGWALSYNDKSHSFCSFSLSFFFFFYCKASFSLSFFPTTKMLLPLLFFIFRFIYLSTYPTYLPMFIRIIVKIFFASFLTFLPSLPFPFLLFPDAVR